MNESAISYQNKDIEEVRLRLEDKIKKGLPLSDEEMMEFIILPLTYKGEEAQKKAHKANE